MFKKKNCIKRQKTLLLIAYRNGNGFFWKLKEVILNYLWLKGIVEKIEFIKEYETIVLLCNIFKKNFMKNKIFLLN